MLCSLRDQLMQMSTTQCSFDQYCISHKTISHRAPAAPSPEVHHECPITYFPALPFLAANPGDATTSVKHKMFMPLQGVIVVNRGKLQQVRNFEYIAFTTTTWETVLWSKPYWARNIVSIASIGIMTFNLDYCNSLPYGTTRTAMD